MLYVFLNLVPSCLVWNWAIGFVLASSKFKCYLSCVSCQGEQTCRHLLIQCTWELCCWVSCTCVYFLAMEKGINGLSKDWSQSCEMSVLISFLLWKSWSGGRLLLLFSGSFIRWLCYYSISQKNVTHEFLNDINKCLVWSSVSPLSF